MGLLGVLYEGLKFLREFLINNELRRSSYSSMSPTPGDISDEAISPSASSSGLHEQPRQASLTHPQREEASQLFYIIRSEYFSPAFFREAIFCRHCSSSFRSGSRTA